MFRANCYTVLSGAGVFIFQAALALLLRLARAALRQLLLSSPAGYSSQPETGSAVPAPLPTDICLLFVRSLQLWRFCNPLGQSHPDYNHNEKVFLVDS